MPDNDDKENKKKEKTSTSPKDPKEKLPPPSIPDRINFSVPPKENKKNNKD